MTLSRKKSTKETALKAVEAKTATEFTTNLTVGGAQAWFVSCEWCSTGIHDRVVRQKLVTQVPRHGKVSKKKQTWIIGFLQLPSREWYEVPQAWAPGRESRQLVVYHDISRRRKQQCTQTEHPSSSSQIKLSSVCCTVL